ncbi:MAG TPA: GGDEF domain-containing protein [Euzebya sp.]|nr:GGDEF domain-containing protein [Euzebya sp.]
MEVEQAHDPGQQSLRATASGIGPAAGLLAVLYALLAVHRLLTSGPELAPTLGGTAATISLLLAGLWWLQGRSPLPVSWAPHLAGGIGALAALNVKVNLLMTGDPIQTINVMLIVVGVAALVEHPRWAGGIIGANLAVWAWVAYRMPSPGWAQFAVGLLSASLLGLVLRAVFRANKSSLERARHAAAQRAIQDELTGLLNRRGLDVVGEKSLATARRMAAPVSIMFIDLDDMKAVNDTQGHLAGDALLVETGRRLTSSFRDADAVARVGGDEFAVLLVGVPAEELVMMRDRARSTLQNASIGIASAANPISTSLVELMTRADAEMYRDKQARRAATPARSV